MRKKKKPNARASSAPIMAHPMPMPAAAPEDTPPLLAAALVVAVSDADELDDVTDDRELGLVFKAEVEVEVELELLVPLEADGK